MVLLAGCAADPLLRARSALARDRPAEALEILETVDPSQAAETRTLRATCLVSAHRAELGRALDAHREADWDTAVTLLERFGEHTGNPVARAALEAWRHGRERAEGWRQLAEGLEALRGGRFVEAGRLLSEATDRGLAPAMPWRERVSSDRQTRDSAEHESQAALAAGDPAKAFEATVAGAALGGLTRALRKRATAVATARERAQAAERALRRGDLDTARACLEAARAGAPAPWRRRLDIERRLERVIPRQTWAAAARRGWTAWLAHDLATARGAFTAAREQSVAAGADQLEVEVGHVKRLLGLIERQLALARGVADDDPRLAARLEAHAHALGAPAGVAERARLHEREARRRRLVLTARMALIDGNLDRAAWRTRLALGLEDRPDVRSLLSQIQGQQRIERALDGAHEALSKRCLLDAYRWLASPGLPAAVRPLRAELGRQLDGLARTVREALRALALGAVDRARIELGRARQATEPGMPATTEEERLGQARLAHTLAVRLERLLSTRQQGLAAYHRARAEHRADRHDPAREQLARCSERMAAVATGLSRCGPAIDRFEAGARRALEQGRAALLLVAERRTLADELGRRQAYLEALRRSQRVAKAGDVKQAEDLLKLLRRSHAEYATETEQALEQLKRTTFYAIAKFREAAEKLVVSHGAFDWRQLPGARRCLADALGIDPVTRAATAAGEHSARTLATEIARREARVEALTSAALEAESRRGYAEAATRLDEAEALFTGVPGVDRARARLRPRLAQVDRLLAAAESALKSNRLVAAGARLDEAGRQAPADPRVVRLRERLAAHPGQTLVSGVARLEQIGLLLVVALALVYLLPRPRAKPLEASPRDQAAAIYGRRLVVLLVSSVLLVALVAGLVVAIRWRSHLAAWSRAFWVAAGAGVALAVFVFVSGHARQEDETPWAAERRAETARSASALLIGVAVLAVVASVFLWGVAILVHWTASSAPGLFDALSVAGTADFRAWAAIEAAKLIGLLATARVLLPCLYTFAWSRVVHRIRPAFDTLVAEPAGWSAALRGKYLAAAAFYACAGLAVGWTAPRSPRLAVTLALAGGLPFLFASVYLGWAPIAGAIGLRGLPGQERFRRLSSLPLLGLLAAGHGLVLAAACPALVALGTLRVDGSASGPAWIGPVAFSVDALLSSSLTLDLFELARIHVTPLKPASAVGWGLLHCVRIQFDLAVLGTLGTLLATVQHGKLLLRALAGEAELGPMMVELEERRVEDGLDLRPFLAAVRADCDPYLAALPPDERRHTIGRIDRLLEGTR